MILRGNPELRAQSKYLRSSRSVVDVILPPFHIIVNDFIHAIGQVNVSGFPESITATGIFLFVVMTIFFRKKTSFDSSSREYNSKLRKIWGIAAGIAGIAFMSSFVWTQFFLFQKGYTEKFSYLPYLAIFPTYLLGTAVVYATFLNPIDAAGEQKKKSFTSAAVGSLPYLLPLLLFFLLTWGIGLVEVFPVYPMAFFGIIGIPFTTLSRIILLETNIICILLSIVPLSIIIRKSSLAAALDECISLWAKHWKNLGVLFVFGGLLLLVPLMLENFVNRLHLPTIQSAPLILLFQGFSIVAGIFLISSFMVFLKEIRE
jgi:hypothetical protein